MRVTEEDDLNEFSGCRGVKTMLLTAENIQITAPQKCIAISIQPV